MSDTIETKKGRGARFLAIAVLLVGLGVAGFYAWSWNHYYRQAPERVSRDMTFMWQWKMYADGMKVAYEKDTYGGDTPEETLQLFVDALKVGDIELASKYYIPEKQGERYDSLLISKQSGNIEKYSIHMSSFLGEKGGFSTSTETYFVSHFDEEANVTFETRLMQNAISKKWKISEP